MRVLVVDDEEMIRNVVVRILKLKKHTPVEAETGDQAKEILSSDHNFDYVILDLNMPGRLSGEQTCQYIIQKFPEIKVIVSSGYVDPATRTRLEQMGVEGILEKPYKIENIMELIS